MRASLRAGVFVAIASVLGGGGFVGCKSDSAPPDETAPGSDAKNAEPLFRALQSNLVATCGGASGACHVRGSQAPHWLGDPDPYLSAKKYPGILPATREPGDSTLLTQVDHVGPTLKRYPALYDKVGEWVTAELPAPPLPSTGAFTVLSGFNSVDLNALGSGLTGARITFLAVEASVGTLVLSALRIHAPLDANVKVDSPFFVVLPRNGKVKAAPAVNGFQGELSIPAGASVPLFTGSMTLTGWDPSGRLKIAFQKIESTVGKGPSAGDCNALPVFLSRALPALHMQLDVTGDDDNDGGSFDAGVVGKGSCAGCHALVALPNEAPATAVQAMDLRALDSDPAIACAFARQKINFQDKAQSLILLNPTGKANPNHPIKPLADADPIVKGIEAWVLAEQP